MTTISGSDLLAIESLRADVARLTAANEQLTMSLGKVAKDQSGTLHHIDRLESDLASRDATIAELRAIVETVADMKRRKPHAAEWVALLARIDAALGKEQG